VIDCEVSVGKDSRAKVIFGTLC